VTAPTRARISRVALANNLARVRVKAAGCRVISVVKADAYGHGLLPVARALASTDAYAVARSEEALALREAGLAHPVILLEGPLEPSDLEIAARYHLDTVIHSLEQLRMLESYRGSGRFTLWLKFDTGTNRLGLSLADAPAVLARVQSLSCVARPLRLMTHLACADQLDHPMSREQLQRFHGAFSGSSWGVSIANSAAILGLPDSLRLPVGEQASSGNWVRPGIMLYGISPFEQGDGADLGLIPAMDFETRLIAVRRVRAGETVGYGATWQAPRDSQIGIAAAGYGDGYPRSIPCGTPVLVEGREMPLAGRISMDMLAMDLTTHPSARVGDTVTLWGRGLPVERIARAAGLIPYELVCRVAQRVSRELVD
jgi:alanine racemase